MSRVNIIAYDFGTSGVKAVLVGTDTRIKGTAMAEYGLLTPRPGFAEQVPEDYWLAVIHATQELLQKCNIRKKEIAAIVFATQAMGIIPLDNENNPLFNNISWLDGRAEKQSKEINLRLGEKRTGPKSVISKLLWLKEEMPDLYAKTRYFVDVNGYLRYRTTGKVTAELTGACSYGVDLNKNSWNEDIFRLAGVEINKLPPILCSTDIVGNLTEEASAELGLSTDTVVVAGCNDVEAAAVGAISIGQGEGHIYLGSSAWLCSSVAELHKPVNGVTISKSPDPSMNLLKGVTQSSGMCLDKAIDLLYQNERQSQGTDEFEVIEREVRAIEAGSDKLIITPWLYGETCPITDESLHSTMFNFQGFHTRAHIIKAIREGIGYNLRWTRDNFDADFGVRFTSLNVVGGGGLSEDWIQCLSDILNTPLKITENMRHAGAIGAAVCAMIGCGIVPDFDGLNRIIRIRKEFVPRTENRAKYDYLFSEYKNLYIGLKDIYNRMSDC